MRGHERVKKEKEKRKKRKQEIINKSSTPTFGSLFNNSHTFTKSRESLTYLLPEFLALIFACQKSHSLFPYFLEH